jgi:hypothetical protein
MAIPGLPLLKSGVDQLTAIFSSGKSEEERVKAALPVLKQLSDGQQQTVSYASRVDEVAKRLPLFESAALGKQAIASALESNEINKLARKSTLPGGSKPGGLRVWDTTSIFSFCIPPNPLLRAIQLRAELNLYKINNCRNIAGVERDLEPFAAPSDTSSGMPTIGAGGQLVVPGLAAMAATPYRYSVLIDRAKQLAQQAVQMEASFLSALEKADKDCSSARSTPSCACCTCKSCSRTPACASLRSALAFNNASAPVFSRQPTRTGLVRD